MADIRWNTLPQVSFNDAIALTKMAYDTGNTAVTGLASTADTFMKNAQTNNNAKAQQYIDSLPKDQLINNSTAILEGVQSAIGNSYAGVDKGTLLSYINARPTVLNAQETDNLNLTGLRNKSLYDGLETNDKIQTLSANQAAEKINFANTLLQSDSPILNKYGNSIVAQVNEESIKNPVFGSRVGIKGDNLTITGMKNSNAISQEKKTSQDNIVTSAYPIYQTASEAAKALENKISDTTDTKEKEKYTRELANVNKTLLSKLTSMGVTPELFPQLSIKYTDFMDKRDKTLLDKESKRADINNKNADTSKVITETDLLIPEFNLKAEQTASNISVNETNAANNTTKINADILNNNPQTKGVNEYLAKNGYGNILSKDSSGKVGLNTTSINSTFSTNINAVKEGDIQTRVAEASKSLPELTKRLEKNSYAMGDDWGGGTRVEKLYRWFDQVGSRTGKPLREDQKYNLLSALGSGQLQFNNYFSGGKGDDLDANATSILNTYNDTVNKESTVKAKLKYDADITPLAVKAGVSKADIVMMLGHTDNPEMASIMPDDIKNSIAQYQAKKLAEEAKKNKSKTPPKAPEVPKVLQPTKVEIPNYTFSLGGR